MSELLPDRVRIAIKDPVGCHGGGPPHPQVVWNGAPGRMYTRDGHIMDKLFEAWRDNKLHSPSAIDFVWHFVVALGYGEEVADAFTDKLEKELEERK